MSLFVCSLNSGSNANCYYVGNQEEAVLIDGGLSCRETVRRMKRLGLSMRHVKAIFVSHEHTDHIYGIPGISKKFQLPVFITKQTLQQSRLKIAKDLIRWLHPYQPVTVGDLSITAFPKLHDACDPQSFMVECRDVRVGVFTDIGAPCEHVVRHFRQCHAAFLETNYDERMLETGRYPFHLKRRIRSAYGHLSNEQALELFLAYRPQHMTHLFLSHLSRENNAPKLVRNIFQRLAGHTKIVVTSRDRETPLYHIRHVRHTAPRIPVQPLRQQLSLFS